MHLIACGTHALLVDSLLFAGPVIGIVLALLIVTWRARRAEAGRLPKSGHPHTA